MTVNIADATAVRSTLHVVSARGFRPAVWLSALFLLLSLADIPAMIAYPTYSVAAIVMVTLVGVIFFKEKLSRRQILSMFMIFAALVLLNI